MSVQPNCEICQLRANGRCPQLDNTPCPDFRIIPSYDREVWDNALEEKDRLYGRNRKLGSRNVERAKERVKAAKKTKQQPEVSEPTQMVPGDNAVSSDLFEELRRWRYEESQRIGKPAFTVFHDKTLREIASRDITGKEALLSIRGIGRVKYDLYADAIMEILKKYF